MISILEEKRIYENKTTKITTDNINITFVIEDVDHKKRGNNYWRYQIVGKVNKESSEYQYSINYYELTIFESSTQNFVKIDFDEKKNYDSYLINNTEILGDLKTINDRIWNINEYIYLRSTLQQDIVNVIQNLLVYIRSVTNVLDSKLFQHKKLFNDIWS